MAEQNKQETQRLESLDALRGFDMFWIMGGEGIFIALGALTGWPVLEWWATHMDHVPWHGFHFYDMIFPLFLFIAGISFPFSYTKRYHGPENRKTLYIHLIKRCLILVILGIIYNNGISFDFSNMRYGSVLGHIGLAWFFAALIFIHAGPRFRVIWLTGILAGYWLLLALIPVSDLGVNDPYSMAGSLVGYVDRLLMPGRLYLNIHDPEGILNTVPAIATALLGMLTGQFILNSGNFKKPLKKVLIMMIAAGMLILTGYLWNFIFPVNKNLWTSSFVCVAGGWSLFLFAVFYLVIDVWKMKKWAFFFKVIGLNSITIYMAHAVINFGYTQHFIFNGFISLFGQNYQPLIHSVTFVLLSWLFLYFLYRKKIFLKV
jgi:predicted acyltransferase